MTLIYLAAMLPILGILIVAMVGLAYQQRSQTVVFHAKQAIAGQAFVLLVSTLLCLMGLLAHLVGVLSPALHEAFLLFDKIAFFTLLLLYVVCCFYYAWMSLEGRDLEYPLIGARLRGR